MTFRKEESFPGKAAHSSESGVGALLVVSAAISCIFYHLFYHYAPVFWGMNSKVDPAVLTPWIYYQMWNRDGIEVYVLYGLMFAVLASVYCFWKLLCWFKTKQIRFWLLVALIPAALYYLKLIGFHPPAGTVPGANTSLGFLLLIIVITALLGWLEAFNKKLAVIAVGLVSLPVFFISAKTVCRSVYWFDTSYIFTPALQLLHGVKLTDLYFQYDVLLSLIAALWLKLGIDPALFQRLGQGTLYLLIVGIYLFSRRFFVNKYLSIPLFIVLVLLREYASLWDPTSIPQTIPLRLDLWFILLILVYARGAAHWSVGLAAGVFVLLHRAFGLIYAASYFQLIALLFALDFIPALMMGKTGVSPGETAKKHFFANLPNVSIVAVCFALNLLLLGWDNEKCGVMIIQQLGIGFLKIERLSFYWYAPILFGALFVLLISRRKVLPERYFTTGLFLVLLSLGNSLYFFGRSSEGTLLVISGSFVLCLFMFLDLSASSPTATERPLWRRLCVMALPYICVLFVASYYSENIIARARVQYENLKKRQLIYAHTRPDLSEVKKITRGSQKLYFMVAPTLNDLGEGFMEGDFLYYYYGDYVPVGFWSPYQTWLVTKDLAVFLQDLLDKGYYLVANAEYYAGMGMPPGVEFDNYVITAGGYLIVWKAKKNSNTSAPGYISLFKAAQNLAKYSPSPENYLNLALSCYSNGFFEESASAAKQAYILRPNYAEAFNVAGAAYNNMKMWDEGIAILEKAVLINPGFQLARNNLNYAISQKAAAGGAVSVYTSPLKAARMAAELSPSAETYVNLSVTYYTARLFEESASAAKTALKLRPNYELAYNMLGISYSGMKRWDEAISVLEKAVRINPNFQLAKNNLALARSWKAAGWGR